MLDFHGVSVTYLAQENEEAEKGAWHWRRPFVDNKSAAFTTGLDINVTFIVFFCVFLSPVVMTHSSGIVGKF